MVIQIRINAQPALAGIQKAVSAVQNGGQAGLVKAAEDGYNDSQRLVHVRTGQLKRSGYVKSQGKDRAEYGYTAEYAGWEEFGHSRRPAHPYVMPRYKVLNNGLAADYIAQSLRAAW